MSAWAPRYVDDQSNDREEQTMVVIELQYDAFSRSFTALNSGAADLFEDGQLYLVSVLPSGFEADVEVLDLRNVKVAHA